MLQQRPTKSDDLTGWLELFVKQVEQAGSGDHSIPTKQAVRDILTEQGALFNGRLLSKTKSLEQIILFVEDLNLPNKKPKPKIQDQEANEIAMEVNEFYDNYNSKHLNYTNKKFIKQTGERTKYEHSHRYWTKDNDNFLEYTGDGADQKNVLAITQDSGRSQKDFIRDLYGSSDEEDYETADENDQDADQVLTDDEIFEKILSKEPSTTSELELGESSH
ncbi:unnamed protein product [[Candida] boidinii]|nr:unnamed protein product [[Candida] boidinii]